MSTRGLSSNGMERGELLTFEEMTRLTGGEPLLRRGLEDLVGMLAALQTPDGGDIDIALTTNGSMLALKAQSLKDAGLKRVTVSLDSLDDATFKAMNDVNFPVAKVLNGIDVAHEVGLGPIKINMVMKRGQNDQDIVAMARHFKGSPYILRFIEFMDVGTSNGWQMGKVDARTNSSRPSWPTLGESARTVIRSCAERRPVSFARRAKRNSRCPTSADRRG